MKAFLIAGGAILASSTAQAEDCTTIVEQIKRQEASIAEYEKAIEEEGFVDESADEVYRSTAEQVHELLKALNRLRAERVGAKRMLEEIERGKRAFGYTTELDYESELRAALQVMRASEAALKFNIERLNRDLGLVRAAVAMQREVEAKRRELAAHITRADEMGCDYDATQKQRCHGIVEYAFCYRPKNEPECRYLPVRPCDR